MLVLVILQRITIPYELFGAYSVAPVSRLLLQPCGAL